MALKNQADFPAKNTDMTCAQALWIFFILLAGIIIVPGMDMIFVRANALVATALFTTGHGWQGL